MSKVIIILLLVCTVASAHDNFSILNSSLSEGRKSSDDYDLFDLLFGWIFDEDYDFDNKNVTINCKNCSLAINGTTFMNNEMKPPAETQKKPQVELDKESSKNKKKPPSKADKNDENKKADRKDDKKISENEKTKDEKKVDKKDEKKDEKNSKKDEKKDEKTKSRK